MNFPKKLELVGGAGTAILGFLPAFAKHGAHTFQLSTALMLDFILLFVVPGLLVAIGSVLHVTWRKTSGFVLLLIGSTFLVLISLIYFFGGAIFYVFGSWGGIVILTQAVVAIITAISSLVVIGQPANN